MCPACGGASAAHRGRPWRLKRSSGLGSPTEGVSVLFVLKYAISRSLRGGARHGRRRSVVAVIALLPLWILLGAVQSGWVPVLGQGRRFRDRRPGPAKHAEIGAGGRGSFAPVSGSPASLVSPGRAPALPRSIAPSVPSRSAGSVHYPPRPGVRFLGASSNGLAALGALAALALAEVVTALGDARYGVAGHTALLALFLAAGVLGHDERRQALFLCMTAGPLIRIVSLGMPLAGFPPPYWYLLSSIPLFLSAFIVIRLLDISPRSLGLRLPARRVLPVELAVWASSLGLGWVEWLILAPPPIVDGSSVVWIVAAGLILLVCTGLLEELLFRGLIQHVSEGLFGPNASLLFTAALFGVLHTGHRSFVDILFVTAVAVYFGLVVRYTKSLLGVTLAHGTTNFLLFVVLPLTIGG